MVFKIISMLFCSSFLTSTLATNESPLQKMASSNDHCSPSYLIPGMSIPNNAKILELSADSLTDVPVSPFATVSFCNVTVTYTHPGWNDTIHINIQLPLDNWNGRFQGVGGGGWAASSGSASLLGPVANNYSAGNTDAGHDLNTGSSLSWSNEANGNLNIPLLIDFASVALNDLAVVGKQLSNKFYSYGPSHSYWNGCSTGGRQGLMLAQRYPIAYSGIYAASPAINWDRFQIAQYWGQFVMNQLSHHPPDCVFDFITAAAVTACDGLDGVEDGVIAALSLCKFDPRSTIGEQIDCGSTSVEIVEKDAEIVQKTWEGPRTADGAFVWWGINPGAAFEGLTGTVCTPTNSTTNCTGDPFSITPDWIDRWVLDDDNFDLTTISLDDFLEIFHLAQVKYEGLIGTNNPDLSAFKQAGGKMITWHGLADQLIFPNATVAYYQKVQALDPAVRDFYRFFEAPGVAHCGGGAGEVPTNPFDAVVDWVEKGLEPATLAAVSADGTRNRDLCLYPLVSVYKGGDSTQASSFSCEASFS
jgi:hypothetical protein